MGELIIDKDTVSGTIRLKSGDYLYINEGVTLSASEHINDYYADDSIFTDACGTQFGRSLIFARNCSDITIDGAVNAILDGRGYMHPHGGVDGKRVSVIRIVDCENVTIKNVKVINSPAWCIHIQNCKNVLIENVNVISDCNTNNDGIDIDCCKNVRILNCKINNGDDAIVLKNTKNISSENIVIENCNLTTKGSGFKIGTESVGDVKNVKFLSNKIFKSFGCAIKIVPTDGAIIDGVLIKDVNIDSTTGPVFIANGTRMRKYYDGHERSNFSRIKNVVIDNLNVKEVFVRENEVASSGRGVIFISGTKRDKIENVTVKNCNINLNCSCKDVTQDFTVKELGDGYPEYYVLGVSPAYGLYLRHADVVFIENNKFNIDKTDIRKEIVLEDVNNCTNCK